MNSRLAISMLVSPFANQSGDLRLLPDAAAGLRDRIETRPTQSATIRRATNIKHVSGCAVEPLWVVHDRYRRPFHGGLGQQAEHGEPDQKRNLVHRAGGQTDGGAQCVGRPAAYSTG